MTQLTPILSANARIGWRAVQTLVWLVGVAIFTALMVAPAIGIHAFWNVLIPVAPALVAIAPGLWRNICPLGTTALFARHMGLSSRRKISRALQGWLALLGVALLYLIVPLRHVMLDTSGPATALALAAVAALALAIGMSCEWKSGWCSGPCPVHPVEKLYGSKPAASFPNAHCHTCEQCVSTCPDSTPGISPLSDDQSAAQRAAGILMVGGFAGFIWGWFHVPDYAGWEGWHHLTFAYGMPFVGFAVSLLAYLILERIVPAHKTLLRLGFAAAAISCYYWYRLPALFGFGPFPGDGMLIDLRMVLPAWFPAASRFATTGFFFWWLLGRPRSARTWLVRPPFSAETARTGRRAEHDLVEAAVS